jgi:hypothetical protein
VNKTLLHRLERLEAVRPVEHKPVDEELLIGRLQLFLAGRRPDRERHRHWQPHESGLTAYARDVGYADEAELFHVAVNDRAEFERRHLDTLTTRDAHIIGVERTTRSWSPLSRRSLSIRCSTWCFRGGTRALACRLCAHAAGRTLS